MASAQKVKKLAEVAQFEQSFLVMAQIGVGRYALALAERGDRVGYEFVRKNGDLYAHVKTDLIALAMTFYEENFTDGEIEELIKMHSSPVSKKLRELGPKMQENAAQFMAGLNFDAIWQGITSKPPSRN